MLPARYRTLLTACLLWGVSAFAGADEPPARAGGGRPAGAVQEDGAGRPGAQANRFDIWEFRVAGNTLVERTLVERSVYPHLGPARTVAEVEAARKALETLYRDSGFPTVVVDIPEQDVSEGVVELRVVEGKVARLRVSGARYFSLGRIRAKLPALATGAVPYVPALQAQIQELNQATPDLAVTPIFRPGRTPGTVEVDLRVKDEFPLHGDAELNDRYSRDTSRLRFVGSLRYANLWQREHSLSFMYQTAPQDTDDVQVLAATYVWPLGGGRAFAAYAVDSQSNVVTAGDLTVIGDGTIVGARLIQPLPGAPNYYHNATLGLDYKKFGEDVAPMGGEGFNTPIDYLNFMAQYRGTWVRPGARLAFGVGADFGVRGLGNTEAEFENKRFRARPNYIHFGAFADYTRTFENDLQVFLAFKGQAADSPLVSNEQFSAGGAESVRGYLESQAAGDDGAVATVELRSPPLGAALPFLGKARLIAFVDGAALRVRDPLPAQTSRYELLGAGLGLRLRSERGVDASLDWAWPLKGASGVEKHDARAHFRLHYDF